MQCDYERLGKCLSNMTDEAKCLKTQYYNADYSQLSTDEFFFFTGFHRAEEFSRMK